MMKNLTRITLEILRIEDDGAHLILNAAVNGKPARLLIDTGASRTVFDKERIRNFAEGEFHQRHDKFSTGLGTSSMPTFSVILESFVMGDLLLKKVEAVLLDLQHVNGTYGKLGHEAIDGVLGNDILMKHKAVVNYGDMTLSLRRD